MSYLYHQEKIFILDRPPARPNECVPKQTTYRVTLYPDRRITYIAHKTRQTRKQLGEAQPDYETELGLNIGFLRTSSKCFDLAVKHVYGRLFSFHNSAESCLAFLHDHRQAKYQITNLRLWYAPKLCPDSAGTTNLAS